MSKEISLRWGKSIFDCNFCKAEGMQWKEVAPDRWMPFDVLNNEIHHCLANKASSLTRDDVLQHLQELGFEPCIPRTVSWKYAFIASNESQTIYFLVGGRSIDLKLYDYVRAAKFDERGKLFTDGGEFVRNYYHESNTNIHELVLGLASKLVTNTPIDKSLLTGNGKSWREQKLEYIRNLPQSSACEARNEMIEIYEAVSPGDDEDAYLGDGMWIRSDGSLDDRGR